MDTTVSAGIVALQEVFLAKLSYPVRPVR